MGVANREDGVFIIKKMGLTSLTQKIATFSWCFIFGVMVTSENEEFPGLTNHSPGNGFSISAVALPKGKLIQLTEIDITNRY